MVLEISYKLIWLLVVAYPLWSDGKLGASPAEEMAYAFLRVAPPIVAVPWRYVFNTYVKETDAGNPITTRRLHNDEVDHSPDGTRALDGA